MNFPFNIIFNNYTSIIVIMFGKFINNCINSLFHSCFQFNNIIIKRIIDCTKIDH